MVRRVFQIIVEDDSPERGGLPIAASLNWAFAGRATFEVTEQVEARPLRLKSDDPIHLSAPECDRPGCHRTGIARGTQGFRWCDEHVPNMDRS